MTSTQSSDNQILKADTLKRVRVGKARREAILDEFDSAALPSQSSMTSSMPPSPTGH